MFNDCGCSSQITAIRIQYERRFESLEKEIQMLKDNYTSTHTSFQGLAEAVYKLEKMADSMLQPPRVETTRDLYAPLRSDTEPLFKLAELARRVLDPNDLGTSVTFEVRELARVALGKEVK